MPKTIFRSIFESSLPYKLIYKSMVDFNHEIYYLFFGGVFFNSKRLFEQPI